ncbi:MAG TPA: ATP-dependent RNA helicase HrpA [Rhodanobacteraceae bacterium]|nr:ATP-dependent RNA helicase HrpA [Rhodanobacteraceae bacterium]
MNRERRMRRPPEWYAARVASIPPITIDEALPIARRADEIVELIRKHQVLVIAGETGSGKTTQLPKLCLAAGRGVEGMIGCTQPRRLAARAMARRVASELGSEVGDKVGFQVRFDDRVGERTLIKFMTDGILLAELARDRRLSAYDTIVLDEAHERSLNIDFLLGYLKTLLRRRPGLKLIVTSATLDTARFAEHFDGAPVVEVEGRAYPVAMRWRPPQRDETPSEQIVAALDDITREDPRGDVLVFLPGEREIRDAHLALNRRVYRHTEVLPLYARLSTAEQDRVFKPGPARRIVLATNIAETSLTVPRIRYVVDSGSARIKRYSQRSQIERLAIEPVSQAAADQRAGRCGRVAPGTCVRLYDEADYAARPRYTDPEIKRSALANVILTMLDLGLGDVDMRARDGSRRRRVRTRAEPGASERVQEAQVRTIEDFPFLEPPEPRAIADGWRRLAELGAIDDARRLTRTGRELARMPIDVQLARMLVESNRLHAFAQVLPIVAFLGIQDPRERPADKQAQADAAHAAFADPKSDFVGILNLWNAYRAAHEESTQSKLRDWCARHFLSFLRMREWRELHRQLLLQEHSPRSDAREEPPPGAEGAWSREIDPRLYEAIHLSLLAGLPLNVARKDERGDYRGTRERRFRVFPGSALAKGSPQWLFAAQIMDLGGRVYAMHCARVEPRWIERQAAHLLRRTWNDPHWSRARGAVIAHEQVTLFGLTLVEQRTVTFAKQDAPLAHVIFLREALARCELDARADFVRANARVLHEAHEIEAQQRRADLLKSDEELASFFADKLPQDIAGVAALDAWYRTASPAQRAALRWSLQDVLAGAAGPDADAFPPSLSFAAERLRLEYRFAPGDPADGVTLHLPLSLLNAIPEARCEWLVPGMLADKIATLIRGLPKSQRRNYVPAPDFARAFVEAEPSRDEPLGSALATFLTRTTGVAITAPDFSGIEMPPHFSMRFVLHDDHGKPLAEGRDLAALREGWQARARDAFAQRTDAELTREDVQAWDFDAIPRSVRSKGELVAYPALVDLGASVALRVFENAVEAEAAHPRGVRRLLETALAAEFKRARRQLPIQRGTSLQYAPLDSTEQLRSDLVAGAFDDLLAEGDPDVRDHAAFEALREWLARSLFAAAMRRLQVAEPVIAAQAELRPWLESPLIGFARASYDDLREQLQELLTPGFLRALPIERLAQFPRYLRAMRSRAEKLRDDPARDQSRMLQVLPYWREWLALRAAGAAGEAMDALRWSIEEWRVSLFAQELGAAEAVSPKRLAKAMEAAKSEAQDEGRKSPAVRNGFPASRRP